MFAVDSNVVNRERAEDLTSGRVALDEDARLVKQLCDRPNQIDTFESDDQAVAELEVAES